MYWLLMYFPLQQLRSVHPHLHEEDIAKLAAAKLSEQQSHNRLWYRINATRALGGNPKLIPTMSEELQEVMHTSPNSSTFHVYSVPTAA